ncbi:MAG: M23 family metallopeptidase, partial [Pygmaiobacter sp.]
RTQLPDAEGDESAASVEQYRGAIWPLYETMSPVQLWDGKFMPPVTGTRRYGYGMGSVLPGATTSIRHAGVDYNVQSVQPVGAPNAGTVVFSGALGLTGNTVVIEHGGGIKSFLYHLSTLSVTTGTSVTKGMELGTLEPDKTLHYEVRIGNKTVNPDGLLDGTSKLYF